MSRNQIVHKIADILHNLHWIGGANCPNGCAAARVRTKDSYDWSPCTSLPFWRKVMTQNACFDGCYFSIHRLLILGYSTGTCYELFGRGVVVGNCGLLKTPRPYMWFVTSYLVK